MRPHGSQRHDALDRILARREFGHRGAGDPLHRVDAVDRLVHDSAAAIERLGALPAARAVVGVVPPPRHVAGRDRQRAEAAGRRGLVHRLHHGIEPLREDGTERDAGLPRRDQHLVDPFERDLERLLADHVHPVPGGGEHGVEVRAGWGGHRDEIGPLRLEHGVGIGIPGAAELLPKRPSLLLGAAGCRHEFNAVDVAEGPRVHLRDRPDADDGCPHHVLPSFGCPELTAESRHEPAFHRRDSIAARCTAWRSTQASLPAFFGHDDGTGQGRRDAPLHWSLWK